MIRYFLITIFSLTQLQSAAQRIFGSYATDKLPNSRFYFIGQAHNNKANNIIQQEMLFALNNKHGVRYNILEYGHSVAFLINEYLQSGQDSLLLFIDPQATFNFIKAVKTYNDTISNERKIRFYGIDFENRHEGKYTKKAIEIIFRKTKIPEAETLHSLLANIADSWPGDLDRNLERVKNYLKSNEDKSRLLLRNYFVDVLLIVNAQYNFSPGRDEAMINSFKLLYRELAKNAEQPSFFASFGTGHVNPGNSSGIAIKLMEEETSPVRNQVCIIGVQYFNCQFSKDETYRTNEGNLNFLCSKKTLKLQSSKEDKERESITFLPKDDLNKLSCNKNINKFSALFIVSNFNATKFWTWE